jgi:hypothetical protein
MWQSSGVKNKLLAVERKRERDRLRPSFHIKRIYAEVECLGSSGAPPQRQSVRFILNDMTPTGGGFFSQVPFIPGQQIQVLIAEPLKLEVQAKVVWSQSQSSGLHVISKDAFLYRVGVEFCFSSAEEEAYVKAFYEKICEEELNVNSK